MNLRDYEGITWKVKNGKCYYSNELRSIEGYLMYHTDEQKGIEDQDTFIEIEEANYA